jgi:hypothetical protein
VGFKEPKPFIDRQKNFDVIDLAMSLSPQSTRVKMVKLSIVNNSVGETSMIQKKTLMLMLFLGLMVPIMACGSGGKEETELRENGSEQQQNSTEESEEMPNEQGEQENNPELNQNENEQQPQDGTEETEEMPNEQGEQENDKDQAGDDEKDDN